MDKKKKVFDYKGWSNRAKVIYKRCVDKDTLVLCSDLTWKKAGELVENEGIIGFDEEPTGMFRRIRKGVVTHNKIEIAKCVGIRLENGEILYCTPDHSWLVKMSGSKLVWKEAKDLQETRKKSPIYLPKVFGDIWFKEESYKSGYVAAAYDGEGNCDRTNSLVFTQVKNSMFHRVCQYLNEFGIEYTIKQRKYIKGRQNCFDIRFHKIKNIFRLLGITDACRIKDKFFEYIDKYDGQAMRCSPDDYIKVVEVFDAGEREVAILSTSLKTHFTGGYPSHNTYARNDKKLEDWDDSVKRVIAGNCKDVEVSQKEQNELEKIMLARKGSPAGRGVWYSGTESHYKLGGVANNNCWYLNGDDWKNIVIGMDLLMLGGGVGMSVEHRFVSKLPTVKKNVNIIHKKVTDTKYIVPDSREGWCDLIDKLLESYFVTGESFDYSTILIRGYGEKIYGFGGTSSGPAPLIACVEKISEILKNREGKKLKPLDMADIICAVGEMVVAGNVRRSAIMIMGDCWDKTFLRAKRWDLGPLPTQRARANFSVVCDDYEDLHVSFWKSYEIGEPIGIINRKNMRKYGRIGEIRKDNCIGVNPCAEATLENGEPCNLVEIGLANIKDADEFEKVARLMFRYAKRVTLDKYHHEISDKVIKKNRRIGVGITGCLQAPHLFNPEVLDRVYRVIQDEDEKYSKELGIPLSIKTTVIKPSGTMGKMFDMLEGIHGGYSRYIINGIRFDSKSQLVSLLRDAGHKIEPEIKLDGTLDHGTSVIDFYVKVPDNAPVSDEGWDTWKQLDAVKMAQKYWADQSISVTVYYKKEEIPKLKEWLKDNLNEIKTISFLCHSDHGFVQAPLQAISKEEYEKGIKRIKPIDLSSLTKAEDLDDGDCESGACPVK